MTTEPTLPSGVNPAQVNALATLLRFAEEGAFVAAVYNTAAVRDAVMDVLRARLDPLPVYHFTFTEERANPLDYRERLPEDALEARAVVFLYDLYRAGAKMYGHLEMQREALARYPHGLVFWLTPGERGAMVREAPNFWSQRSGVFDFTVQDSEALTQMRGEMAGGSRQYANLDDWERKLRLYRGLVDEYEAMAEPPADTLLDLYNKVGRLYNAVSDRQHALTCYQKVLALAEAEEDRRWQGTALNNIAMIYDARGDYATALTTLQQSLAIWQDIGDKAGEGTTLNNIAMIYDARGDYATALTYLQQSLAIWQDIGDKAGEGVTLNNIAQIYDARGDYATALTYLQQSLAISQDIGDKAGEGATLNNIAALYHARGDYATALTTLQQSLAIRQDIGARAGERVTLYNIAMVYRDRGEYQQANDLLEQVVALDAALGHPDLESDRAMLEKVRSEAGHE